jgi:hypothetical protein
MISMQRVNELMLLFLKATDQAEEHLLLEQIVGEHARPLLTNIIRGKLRLSTARSDHNSELQDSEDIIADVLLQLVKRLRDAKSNPHKAPLNDVTSYVAVAARNAFSTYVRSKHPERSRLKDRICYALVNQKGFALWEAGGRWICGFEVWRQEGREPSPPDLLQQLRDNPNALASTTFYERRNNLPQLVDAIFNWAGMPVEVSDLVNLIAALSSIPGPENTVANEGQGSQTLDDLPDQEPGLATRVEQRIYLERLWAEICQLPLPQRRALLLNLRDSKGQDMTALFSHTRIATLRQVAAALEVTVEEFIRLSSQLPMEDALMAKYLAITRQQVINLRMAARRRLARRMRKLEEGSGQ